MFLSLILSYVSSQLDSGCAAWMCCLLISPWQMAHGFNTDNVHFVPFIKMVSAGFLYYKDTIFLFGIKYHISYWRYFHLCKYTLFLYESVIH